MTKLDHFGPVHFPKVPRPFPKHHNQRDSSGDFVIPAEPTPPALTCKRFEGQNPEGKSFRKLLRREQSSAKISKISRNTLKSSKSDIFYLLRNVLKYHLPTFLSSAKFSEVFTLCVFTLWHLNRSFREVKRGEVVGE